MVKEIVTERLVLRPWKNTEDEAKDLYDYAKDPNVGPNAGWAPHKSVEESSQIIKDVFLKENSWAIREKENDKIIGHISLFEDSIREKVNSMEMGYNLSYEHWGKGYMTEAAKAVLEYGFREFNLDVVAIRTSETNLRSQSVIKKCGFQYEGLIRKAYKIYDGTLRDSRIYSLLREECMK